MYECAQDLSLSVCLEKDGERERSSSSRNTAGLRVRLVEYTCLLREPRESDVKRPGWISVNGYLGFYLPLIGLCFFLSLPLRVYVQLRMKKWHRSVHSPATSLS